MEVVDGVCRKHPFEGCIRTLQDGLRRNLAGKDFDDGAMFIIRKAQVLGQLSDVNGNGRFLLDLSPRPSLIIEWCASTFNEKRGKLGKWSVKREKAA